MSENTTPTDRRFKSRGKIIAAIAAVVLLGACAAVGATAVMTGEKVSDKSAPVADLRPLATAEHAYALSLPVLEAWLEEDFENSWIAVASTLEQAARALDTAAGQPADYAIWVPRFEAVVSLAEAVAKGDQTAAQAALDPLLAAEPGPYADTAVDATLSADPDADVEASLLALDASIAAEDRVAARQNVADTAASLAEVVLAAQVELSAESALEVLKRLLPAFRAVDDIQDQVLHGHARDAADAASKLRTELESFRSWYSDVAA